MRIGFHYHLPAQYRDGRIWTLALQGLFLDSLAPYFEKIVLFLHTPTDSELSLMDYVLVSGDKFELISIGEHSSTPNRLLKGNRISALIAKHSSKIDILLLRSPTPLLPLVVKKIAPTTRFAYLVVGEATKHINDLRQPSWRKLLIKLYIQWNEGRQIEYAQQACVVFTNSAIILESYRLLNPNSKLIRTTTLSRADFFLRQDTCIALPIQILYVGRIEESKGLLTLAEAIVCLNRQGIDCLLNVVGWSEKLDKTIERTRNIFSIAELSDKLIFHGKKKAGPELFVYYRQSDIFVMPSQVNEGFPRTIWEAFAHSLPVITTPVGSISHYVKDRVNGLLFEPGNTTDLIEKVKLLIQSPNLRHNIIVEGFNTAKDSTLEVQAKNISMGLKQCANEK
jgi:glycosyltransferase involved in cell wall biosynthesis